MKRVRFTEEQIIAVMREHEAGAKTADLVRLESRKRPCKTERPSTDEAKLKKDEEDYKNEKEASPKPFSR